MLLIGNDGNLAVHLALSYEQVTHQSATQLMERPPAVAPATFDLVAVPNLGDLVASGKRPVANPKSMAVVAGLQAAYHLTRPGGALYVGFSGRWAFRRLPRGEREGFTPEQVRRWLRQAGYSSFSVYGAIPNHQTPLYLFPLEGAVLGFVLRRHLKKLRPAWLREGLARPGIARWGQAWLPGYSIVGVRG